jgi:hypothetical protein
VDPALTAPSLPLPCSCSAILLVHRIRSSGRRHGRQDLIRRGQFSGPLRSYLPICGSSRPGWDPRWLGTAERGVEFHFFSPAQMRKIRIADS